MAKCCKSWCNNEAYVLSRFVDDDGERDGLCKEHWYDVHDIKAVDNKCAECGKALTGMVYAIHMDYTKRYCSERCLANALAYRLAEDFNNGNV